jgi:hypothetical protein
LFPHVALPFDPARPGGTVKGEIRGGKRLVLYRRETFA